MMGAVVSSEALVIKAIWFLVAALWLVLAFRAKRTVQRRGRVMAVFLVSYLAIIVTSTFLHSERVHRVLWTRSSGLGAAAVLLAAAGACVAVWARVTIGTNWSGVVTLKEGHELIESGPYRFVRHPIYAGILLMALGTQLLYAEGFGFILLIYVAAAFTYKIRVEEQLMSQQFPSQYMEYRRHVKAIIPYLL